MHAAPGWYADFLRNTVIRQAAAFGWVIQLGEVAVALLLFTGAAAAVAGRGGRAAAAGSALGAFGGFLLALNLGLSDDASFFSLVAPDSFEEGVPLDVLAVWLLHVLLGVALVQLVELAPLRVSRRRPGLD